MRLLYGQDAAVGKFVADRIPQVENNWGPMAAIGVVDDDNSLIAGFVYNMYYPEHGTIQISAASDSPKWATRKIIREVFSYAFNDLGVNKICSAIPLESERVIKFNKALGFIQEAVLAHQFGPKKHAAMLRLMKKDFEAKYG